MSNPFLDASTSKPAAQTTADVNPFINDPTPRHATQINPKQLYKHGNNVLKSFQYFQQHPMEGWNALDQALPRAIGGALGANGLADVPRSTFDAVTHPGQVAQQDDRVARNLHLRPTKALQSQTLSDAAADPTTQALSPDIGTSNAIAQLLGSRAVLRSGIELAENIPQLARKELDAGFWAIKAGGNALKALGHNPFFSTLYHAADALHPARNALQPDAFGRTVGRLAQANSASARKTREFQKLLDPHRDHLNALHIDPSRSVRRTGAQALAPEAMQALDELTWAEMTPTARRQAQHAGMKVTPQMAAMPPGNTLNRYDPHYFPTQRTGRRAAAEALSDALPTIFRRGRANAGGYQNAGRDGQIGDDIYEQLLGRYRTGARNVENAHAQRDILTDIGFGARPDVTTAVQQLRNARRSGNAFQTRRAEEALQEKLAQRTARQARQTASLKPGARLTARNLNVELNGRPLGNIFLPYESALMMARRSDRIQGNDPNAAFKTQGNIPTNELLDSTAIGPQQRRMKDAQSAFNRAEKVSKAADASVQDTRAAASRYALAGQKRVEGAVNDLRTSQNLRDQKITRKLLKARGDDFKNFRTPLGKAVADIRDTQQRRGGGEYLTVKDAGRGRDIRGIVSPSAASSIVARRNARTAASNFLRQKGKLDSITNANSAIDRVSSLADQHLKRTGNLTVPNALDHLFFGDNASLEGLAKLNPLNKLAELTRAATFTMAAPHGNNILDQTLQGGPGLMGALRGVGRAVQAHRNDPSIAPHIQQLRDIGQDSNYAGHEGLDYGKIPVIGKHIKRVADAGQHALDSFDTGQKIAAMEHLKRKGVKPDQLANEMQNIYGGAPRSLLEQVAKAIGVYYPSFAMSTVPRTVAHAMVHNPRAVNSMMLTQAIPTRRSEESNDPHEYNLFPELNEGREALAFPFGTADYAMKKVNSAHALYDAAHGSLSAVAKDVEDFVPFHELMEFGNSIRTKAGRKDAALQGLELAGPRVTPESRRQLREKRKYERLRW